MIWWSIVILAVLFIGVTKSGFGSGVGLMIVPMTAIALAHIPGRVSEDALGLLLPLLIAGDLIAVWQYRKLFFRKTESNHRGSDEQRFPLSPSPGTADRRSPGEGRGEGSSQVVLENPPKSAESHARAYIAKLMPGTILGVIVGGTILWAIHSRGQLVGALIRIEIGCESILLVSLHWWRLYRGTQNKLLPEPLRCWLTGSFAAVSSTLAHAAGPIIAMYLLPLELERQLYVGTCAVYFFILNTCKLPAYYAGGQFAHVQFSFTAQFLPLVIIGALFGRWLVKRMTDTLFIKIVYIVTFALGWYILADGILRLFGHQIG